ncbi:hypothetical protein LCGC14_1583900 [marine sediment metagenome]|uniref:Uncharacterized protein n=1 Tax=marine sediment metagenome TaxID=412755 RepID=A0A0F9IG50_9ZZZZ
MPSEGIIDNKIKEVFMDYIYLQGSEDVQRAAVAMQSAADTMRSSTGNLASVIEQHERFMTEWLDRFETILKENK